MADWKTTIEMYGPDVWRIVYRIVGNEADASDCFQEVFLAVVQSARKKPVRNMPGFLRLLAVQRSIDYLRSRRKHRLTTAESPNAKEVAGNLPSPDQPIQSDELVAAVRRALAELPPAEAEAFTLRAFQDLSYRQIAQTMRVKESYAGVLINRARAKLQELLQHAAADYGWEFIHER